MRSVYLTTSIVLFFLLLTLSGCLVSTSSFYLPNQKITDDRIIGTYVDKDAGHRWEITRSDGGSEKAPYTATLRQGDAWSSYGLTLFKLEGTTYFDLFPENNSSLGRNPGGPPTAGMIMHYLTNQPLHMVSQVKISDQQLEIITLNREGLGRLTQLKPEMGNWQNGKWILNGATAELQELLQETSSNPKIFNETLILPRDPQLIKEQSKTYRYNCPVCQYQGVFSPGEATDRQLTYRLRCQACGYQLELEKSHLQEIP